MPRLYERKLSGHVSPSGVVEVPANPNVSVKLASNASPLEQFAGRELKRLATSIFGQQRVGAGKWPEFLIGVPEAAPEIASKLAGLGQASLQEQEYLILPCKTGGKPLLVLAGGSQAAVLWAVYDLAEFWGFTYLTDREVAPSNPPAQVLPPHPIRRLPWLPLRAWRGFNQLPHSGAYWGLQDYQKLIDQLAKMRFNCFFIADGPNTPLVDFTWAGLRKHTATLSFGWRYPVDQGSIGYEKFNGACWYENPEIPYEGTYEEKVAATKRLIRGVLDHAGRRGMKTCVAIRFTEFPDEFKEQLCQQSKKNGFTAATAATKAGYVYRLGIAREGADPDAYSFMTVRNPNYVDLIHAQLDAYLTQCAGCDYYMFWPPEFNNADADAEYAWQALRKHYPLGEFEQFETLVQNMVRDRQTTKNATPADRLRQQAYNFVCSLYLLDELLNRQGLKARHRLEDNQLVFHLPSPELGAIATHVLGADAGFLVGLGNNYHASSAAKHIHQIDACEGLPESLHLTLSLEDDNIGLTPQFTGPSLDRLLKSSKKHKIGGVWCRQWLLNKIEPTIHYLSHVCWDRDMSPPQAYRVLAQRLCGDAAADAVSRALALGEQMTVENDEALNLHSFLVPKLLAKYWQDGVDLEAGMIAMPPKYQQLQSLFEQARDLSDPRGWFFLDRHIAQCRFAAHWITAMQRVREAALADRDAQEARQQGRVTQMDERLQASVTLLDQAIEACKIALTAWADAVGDRADLGALAALNEYGYRYLQAIRHIQFIRSQHWDCQLSPSSQ